MATVSDRRRATNTTRGFTLLEVMIAVSILSIGFFAIYSLFLQSLAASEEARFRQQAASLSTLKQRSWATEPLELSLEEGDFGADYPGWRWRQTPSKVESEEFEAVANRLSKVRLEVYQVGGNRQYGVTHYLFVPEAP